MALNDIQLNSALLTEMYRGSLVDLDDSSKQVVKSKDKEVLKKNDTKHKTQPTPAAYLGSFGKKILLVVRYPDSVYLPDEQLNFLTSILGACRLGLADVAILNVSRSPWTSYKQVQGQLRSVVTVLFGLTPEQFEMPINFPEFQIQPFDNCVFLHAPVLETLESDKILKSKLWVSLKKIFNLP